MRRQAFGSRPDGAGVVAAPQCSAATTEAWDRAVRPARRRPTRALREPDFEQVRVPTAVANATIRAPCRLARRRNDVSVVISGLGDADAVVMPVLSLAQDFDGIAVEAVGAFG